LDSFADAYQQDSSLEGRGGRLRYAILATPHQGFKEPINRKKKGAGVPAGHLF